MQPLLLGCFCTVGFVCLLRFWGGRQEIKQAKHSHSVYMLHLKRPQTCIYFCTFFTNFRWEPSQQIFKDEKTENLPMKNVTFCRPSPSCFCSTLIFKNYVCNNKYWKTGVAFTELVLYQIFLEKQVSLELTHNDFIQLFE